MKLKTLIFCFLLMSCIPTRVPPKIVDFEIRVAKKFHKKLQNQHSFVFEDSKEADDFYQFMNLKFKRNHEEVESNVPVEINSKRYYLSFYEVEKPLKTINLIPMFIDSALENKDRDPIMSDAHTTRIEKWFLVLTVSDDDINDNLNPNYPNQRNVINYLKALKKQYLSTQNYNELLFRD